MSQSQPGLIPISLFGSVRENHTEDQPFASWDEIENQFLQFSHEEIDKKEDAILFASTHFEDGKRCAKNAIQSGMLILDVDSGAQWYDAVDIFEDAGIAGLMYSTASHTDEHHKFRICVPLVEPVSPKEYTKAWFGLNAVFGSIADPSKKTCESLFYAPGHLPGRIPEFYNFDGEVLSGADWASLYDGDETLDEEAPSRKTKTSKKTPRRSSRRFPALEYDDVNGVDIYRNPIVPVHAIRTYLGRSQNWHHGRYGFMCSVALKALKHNYPLSAYELRDIFNQLDSEDGGHYQSRDYQSAILRDAENAISQAI